MAIEVISIGSSSSGNSYLIMAGKHNIILDVGLAAKRIIAALEKFNITPEEVDAVLVTHEHVDHVRSVRAIGRKCKNAVFITSRGTAENTENFKYIPDERLMIAASGDRIYMTEEAPYKAPQEDKENYTANQICFERVQNANRTLPGVVKYSEKYNNITISAFAISHDAAEPLSYTIEYAGEKLAIVTDTGIVTDSIYEAIRDADILVFESNHDEDLLMFGEYPYPLKMRIKGDYGHLSNHYAGEILMKLLSDRAECRPAGNSSPLHIMLAHLSFHNNAPFYARTTVEEILQKNGFEKGRDYTLTIAARDELTLFD